jgi:hypothetical protein
MKYEIEKVRNDKDINILLSTFLHQYPTTGQNNMNAPIEGK